MTRPLLNRLPDIFACAAVRSSEAMHALGLRPEQRCRVDTPAMDFAVAPHWDLHLSGDVAALMGMLAGQAPFPRVRQQLGLLWLSTQPPMCQLGSMQAPESLQSRHASLIADFAHRLLLGRELLSPSALVVVEGTPDLAEGISLVMQTVFGHKPQWKKFDGSPGAPSVLVCPADASCGAWPNIRNARHGAGTHLLQWLREVPTENATALALGPHLDLSEVWPAWRGGWVVTHADPAVFERLQLQCRAPFPSVSR